MSYVDGFVIPILESNVDAYRTMAQEAGVIWKKHGALHYFECVGDDLNPALDAWESTTFPELAKLTEGETVIFSFIVFESRAHRDEVNAKVMEEMAAVYAGHEQEPMPFDAKRVAYGGFSTIVET